jgi:hypothetical protein
MRFADNGVAVLRRIFHAETLLPMPIHLPDGTVISLCELLSAMPGEEDDAAARKIPTEKVSLEEKAPDRFRLNVYSPHKGGKLVTKRQIEAGRH